MTFVATVFQGVVKIAHDAHGLKVDRVLILEPMLLISWNKGEIVDVMMQFGQWELDHGWTRWGFINILIRLQVVQGDPREVGYNDVARYLIFSAGAYEILDVAEGLRLGFAEVFAETLMLDQQHPAPEEIDVVIVAREVFNRFLECGHGAAAEAKDLEKLVPKRLLLGTLASSAGPFTCKADGVLANFVPGNWHIGLPYYGVCDIAVIIAAIRNYPKVGYIPVCNLGFIEPIPGAKASALGNRDFNQRQILRA